MKPTRTRKRAVAVLFVAGAVLGGVPAIPDEGATLLDRLAYEWSGEGMVLGRPSRASLVFDHVLERQFVRLRFRNEMQAEDGRVVVFEGHGYYSAPDAAGELSGWWFDSRGLELPIQAKVTDRALIVDWGTEGTEQGRTTYTLEAVDELLVVDEVRSEDGTLAEFGRIAYRKD